MTLYCYRPIRAFVFVRVRIQLAFVKNEIGQGFRKQIKVTASAMNVEAGGKSLFRKFSREAHREAFQRIARTSYSISFERYIISQRQMLASFSFFLSLFLFFSFSLFFIAFIYFFLFYVYTYIHTCCVSRVIEKLAFISSREIHWTADLLPIMGLTARYKKFSTLQEQKPRFLPSRCFAFIIQTPQSFDDQSAALCLSLSFSLALQERLKYLHGAFTMILHVGWPSTRAIFMETRFS